MKTSLSALASFHHLIKELQGQDMGGWPQTAQPSASLKLAARAGGSLLEKPQL